MTIVQNCFNNCLNDIIIIQKKKDYFVQTKKLKKGKWRRFARYISVIINVIYKRVPPRQDLYRTSYHRNIQPVLYSNTESKSRLFDIYFHRASDARQHKCRTLWLKALYPSVTSRKDWLCIKIRIAGSSMIQCTEIKSYTLYFFKKHRILYYWMFTLALRLMFEVTS